MPGGLIFRPDLIRNCILLILVVYFINEDKNDYAYKTNNYNKTDIFLKQLIILTKSIIFLRKIDYYRIDFFCLEK